MASMTSSASETFEIPMLPFGETRTPEDYLGGAWHRLWRSRTSGRLLSAPEGTGTPRIEYWCGAEPARLRLRVDGVPSAPSVLALNLRGVWTGVAAPVRIRVRVGDSEESFEVDRREAQTKLVQVPPSAFRGDLLVVELQADEAWEDVDEAEAALPFALACEVSAVAIHADTNACLAWVQSEYDAVRRYRDELFDCGVSKLGDRGQILDKLLLTLGHLEALGAEGQFAIPTLQRVLDDPHVQGRGSGEIRFDESYLLSHGRELREGLVMQAIRKWRAGMEAFHTSIVKLGNRAFLARGEHRLGAPREEDALRELVDGISIPAPKLQGLKERNDLLNTLELLLQRDELQSVVPSLEIEMSSFCNYACVMCGRSWYSFQFARQSDQQLLQVLRVMPYLRHITIAGVGENTTSDRLEVFARMTQVFDVETRIFTNGSKIHEQLDALSRFDKVCVSFDGGTAATFETQRRGAKFDRVLRNIRLLRERAPDIEIAFSTVVSRINLLEVPLIVQHAADLGVDHVALSPVWEVDELRLRASDQKVFEKLLTEAKRIAKAGRVTLQVNVIPEDFSVIDDKPLDVQATRDFANGLDFPSLTVPSWSELERSLSGMEFCYHPPTWVFPDGRWPDPPPGGRRAEPVAELPMAFDFDIDAALEQLDSKIASARQALADAEPSGVQIPYCLSIWKYTYMHANGKNRLCPQVFTDVGNVARHGMQGVTNGEKNRAVRRTMYGGDLLDHCKRCLDPYRRWGHDRVAEQVRKMGLKPLDRSRYSVTHGGR